MAWSALRDDWVRPAAPFVAGPGEPNAAAENAVTVDATLEAVVRRDRLVVVTALAAVIALSWAYLLDGAGTGMSAFEMTRMSQLGMARGMFEGGMAGMAMMAPAV